MKFFYTFIALSLLNCSLYSPRLADYPEQERQTFLMNPLNRTFEGDVHVELERILREEIHRKEDFLLTSEKENAKIGLYPELMIYRKEGRMYDQYRTPVRYELIVGAKMRIIAFNRTENATIAVVHESASTGYSETEGFPETEFRARQRVFRLLARKLNDAAVREWLKSNRHE